MLGKILLLFLTVPLCAAIYRGLESTGALPMLDAAFKASDPTGKSKYLEPLEFVAGSYLARNLKDLHPSRMKRAIEEKDMAFASSLRTTMENIFKTARGKSKLSGSCLASLLSFVDAFTHLLTSSSTLDKCATGENPLTEKCNCLRNASAGVSDNSWVLKFLDSMGKLPSGILHGNLWFLGDFQQCLNIAKVLPSDEVYRGRFCLTKVGMSTRKSGQCPSRFDYDGQCSPHPLNIGICIPETCRESDILTVVEEIMKTQKPDHTKQTTANGTERCLCLNPTCHKRELPYDAKAIVMLVILGVLVAVMAAGTFYEYFVFRPEVESKYGRQVPQGRHTQEELANGMVPLVTQVNAADEQKFFDTQIVALRVIMAFSILRNGRKLFDTTKRPGQVHCLHGLRFLSLAWVILGHTYFWIIPTLDNLIGVRPLTKNAANQIILNATYCVDCFFLQSGFLLCYLWLKDTTRSKGANIAKPQYWIMFYVHRYIRLTPVYALILAVDICLYRYIADGPFWNQDGLEPNYCRRSWWTNMIYLNNFLVQDELCMSWTWYLANDFQFYFFAPIVLLLLWKYEVIGIAVALVTLIGTGVIRAVITVAYNLPPISLASMHPDAIETANRHWDLIYVKPYCRCGVYIVGLLLGYAMFKLRGKRVKIHWSIVSIGWVVVTIMHLALLFGLYNYSGHGVAPSKAAVFIYSMVARPLWGVGLAWIIFMCEHGYAGWINNFLSWEFWIPLSKLTYCAYLIHAFVAHGTYNSRFQSAHFDTHLRMVYYFFGHLVVSYVLAMFFHFACEAPILTLERIIFGTRHAKPPATKPAQQQIQIDEEIENAAGPSTNGKAQ